MYRTIFIQCQCSKDSYSYNIVYTMQGIKDGDTYNNKNILTKRVSISNDTLDLLRVGVEYIIFRNMKFLLGVIIIIDFFL